MENLKAKIFFLGNLEVITGLHIGGSPTALNIGGVDTNVIKTPDGVPFIPGSSLKGKLRALYGMSKGYIGISRQKDDDNLNNHYDDEDLLMKRLFGTGLLEGGEKGRIIIRDSYLDLTDFNNRRKTDFLDLEFEFTESKWENTIGRIDSKSIPRQVERTPAGSKFIMEFILNIFDETDLLCINVLAASLRLLQDDYIGGNGSRGYGKVLFNFNNLYVKPIKSYESDNKPFYLKSILSLDGDNEELINEIKNILQL
jgi:CRISPR-associated protein Csm3